MKRTRIAVVACLLFSLSGCYVPREENSVYYNHRVDLLSLFLYSVPFMDEVGNKSIGDIELYSIEEDSYGRTLGVARFNEHYTHKLFGVGAVYCVLQRGSQEECSFYEDVCCAAVSAEEPDEEIIQSLKTKNDWSLPLNEAKMLTIPIENYAPGGKYSTFYEDNTAYREAAEKALGLNQRGYLDFLCKDAYGRILCTLWVGGDKSAAESSQVYLIMMRDGDVISGKEKAGILSNRSSPWEELRAFKETHDWNSPG